MESKEDELVLLDTNILVYAFAATPEDAQSKDRKNVMRKIVRSRELLRSALRGEIRACVAAQNIAEFYSVATSHIANPVSTPQAASIARALASSSAIQTIYETEESFGELFAWLEAGKTDREPGARVHDCRLAFAAKASGVSVILTENVDDFSCFEFISPVNPFREAQEGAPGLRGETWTSR